MYTYLDAYNTYTAERPFDKQNLLHKFYEFKKNVDEIIKEKVYLNVL